MSGDQQPGSWQAALTEGQDSLFARLPGQVEDAGPHYRTLTYAITGRVARITFNRPEHGNAITADIPGELAHAVERDLDPGVHVMLVFGRGTGFCGGYDLGFAERAATQGFRQAVHDRDEPFGDQGRSTFKG